MGSVLLLEYLQFIVRFSAVRVSTEDTFHFVKFSCLCHAFIIIVIVIIIEVVDLVLCVQSLTYVTGRTFSLQEIHSAEVAMFVYDRALHSVMT